MTHLFQCDLQNPQTHHLQCLAALTLFQWDDPADVGTLTSCHHLDIHIMSI